MPIYALRTKHHAINLAARPTWAGMGGMKLDVSAEQITINAQDLAPLIGCAPAEVPQLMRAGRITSTFEKGEGEDAGRFRVTFRYGTTRVRFTCAEDGTVLSHIRTQVSDG